MTACRNCGGQTRLSHNATIMGKHPVDYVVCTCCQYLQVVDPHWLEQAYAESINLSDTGLVSRNINLSRSVLISLFAVHGVGKIRNSRYLDYGGGYGLFVRLMRDIGLDFYWHDPFSENLFSRGFERSGGQYDGFVAFEVLEHLEFPGRFFEEVFQQTDLLICSTELYGDSPPPTAEWDYYALSHGQHIGFFNSSTLRFIASKYQLDHASDGRGFHIFSRDRLPQCLILLVKALRFMRIDRMISRAFTSKTLSDHAMMVELESQAKVK
ncbi:methyltransferase domain-containing protein [Seongchinamella unica]|uniref:Methyltransferase domain-containing protein n=1 Tax=Seongchinamella unica TaxID=2547392 RepID=A0A4R5LQD1_9GAMM|nr:class I SAM-dependent methyltransferase [Seongchinamella unica]TDG12758.1 methyltransferase domain-containing protein [Seongchinamella unica]